MNNNNLPAAKEWLHHHVHKSSIPVLEECMIKFAQLHVQEALKAAYENGRIYKSKQERPYEYADEDNFSIVKESILNAYPLNNIK